MNGVHNSYALARVLVAERSSVPMPRPSTPIARRRRIIRRRRRRVWTPLSLTSTHPIHARPVASLA